MNKLNSIIIEDEPLAAEILMDYIAQVPFLQNKGHCSNALIALEVLQTEKIDVIFLDIHMPKLKGLDMLKSLHNPPQIIITTAYRDYAIESFELNVTDYLLKPINFSRFLMAVNKLKIATNKSPEINNPDLNEKAHLYININKKRIKIYLSDIIYIESKKEYINIVTTEKAFLPKFQISEIEEQLGQAHFLRTHRSFIVSKEKITAFNASCIEINDLKIPIGRSYKELVLSVLSEPK